MNETFLDKILRLKRKRVAQQKIAQDIAIFREHAATVRTTSSSHALRSALSNTQGVNIIAEIKRASPSKGEINANIDIAKTAREYEAGGACAISVLTEEDFFLGSLGDIETARAATALPILRKDFIVDEFQIYEAAAAGADAVLLIVAALSIASLAAFHRLAEDELKMDALVEVHSGDELAIARDLGAGLIGINNRDLRSFEVSLDVSRRLIGDRPAGSIIVSESGINGRDDILELRSLGFDGFLVGETLMRTDDAAATLRSWN